MKIDSSYIGKRVYIRLRVGGSYTGVIQSAGSTLSLLLDDKRQVMIQSSMIASMQILGDVKNE